MNRKIKLVGLLFVSTMLFFACSEEQKELPTPTKEENIAFADANFKKALVENYAINTNKDGEIQKSEAEAFNGKVDVKAKKIAKLNGLEYFVNITELDCSNNNLTSLDLTKNTKLQKVFCQHNQITEIATKGVSTKSVSTKALALSANVLLEVLDCSYNKLASIDLTANVKLKDLDCSHNLLETLNVSKNVDLSVLDCSYNKFPVLTLTANTKLTNLNVSNNEVLTELNLVNGNNKTLTSLDATKTPNLKTIKVDEETAQNPPTEWKKEAKTIYTDSKGDNPTNLPYIELTTEKAVGEDIKLIIGGAYWDDKEEKYIDVSEEEKAKYWIDLNLNGQKEKGEEITKFYTGDDVAKEILNVPYRLGSQTIRIYGNITFFVVGYVEVKGEGDDEESTLIGNQGVVKLDVSHNPNLKFLICKDNKLTDLDLSKNTELSTFGCSSNKIVNLDLSQNSKLFSLDCQNNKLQGLDISNCTKLNEINTKGNLELMCIKATEEQIEEANRSRNNPYNDEDYKFDAWTTLSTDCSGIKPGTEADYIEFTTTKAVGEQIVLRLDAKEEDKAGVWVDTNNNGKMEEHEKVVTFDELKSQSYTLESQTVRVYGKLTRFVTEIDYKNRDEKTNQPKGQQLTNLIFHTQTLESVWCGYNQIEELDVSGLSQLKSLSFEKNNISDLDVSNCKKLRGLTCSGNKLRWLSLENNKELEYLSCGGNEELDHLNVSNNTKLTELYCSSTKISDLDISQNKELVTLYCAYNNMLRKIDVSNNTKLKVLRCESSGLELLDVIACTDLRQLFCGGNYFKHSFLDLSQNTKLIRLECQRSHLRRLELYNNKELLLLHCEGNELNELDLSQNSKLEGVYVQKNKLYKLDVSGCPNLGLGKSWYDRFDCRENELSCIKVSPQQYDGWNSGALQQSWQKDEKASFNVDCY